jgi:hypothetical protein
VDRKRWKIASLTLLVLALAIRWFAAAPSRVESVYSLGVYPWIGRASRSLTGILPFSLGDLLYMLLGAWLLWSVVGIARRLSKNGWRSLHPWKTVAIWLVVYVFFNLFWGLNYNRLGISHQLELEVEEPRSGELSVLCQALLDQTNRYARFGQPSDTVSHQRIRASARAAYHALGDSLPFLRYAPSSVKGSLFGVLGNYLGYTGYFNPLTGEAQVNEHVPRFLSGFVTCHEIAHQLGYAKENEANFVGFLAARASSDSLLRYSAYFDMFLYANRQLYLEDSTQAMKFLRALDPIAQRDLADLRAFRVRYHTVVEDWVDQFYHQYLMMNQQPEGRKSYGRVVLWLLAQYRKDGGI